MNNILHGGDLDFVSQKYKIPKDEIIDFSSNLNPLGTPESVKNSIIENIDAISTYPDKDYTELKKSIKKYINFDVNLENILVGNGTTELISIFIRTIKPKNSLIISPSYSEYEREIIISGGNTFHFYLDEDNDFNLNINRLIRLLENISLLIICNPNSPTGSIIKIEDLEKIIKFCEKNDTFVIIDETYIEFSKLSQKNSAIYLTKKYKNIFVIRGTSKFFCVPGLRLGYAICNNKQVIEIINKEKNPWSVNSFANICGIAMFKDLDFIEKSLCLISSEKDNLYKKLSSINCIKPFYTFSNFILVKILNKDITSFEVFEKLIKNKIFIRDSSNFKNLDSSFFRFCILNKKENILLLNQLKDIFK